MNRMPGIFILGADNRHAIQAEYSKRKVTVDEFWIDVTKITSAQFAAFVKATG